MTKIVITKEIPKNPIVIEGFPSKGFVSTIATRHMIDELGMEVCGYIESNKMESIAVVHQYTPMRPIRIYAKDNLVLIFSELIVSHQNVMEFSMVLMNWFDKIAPKQVILLAGISGLITEKEHEIMGISTTPELDKKLEEAKIKKIEEGMLTGISSELLLGCIEKKIPAISLMAETHYTPDPLAAASMVKILNILLGTKIDTKNLIEEGKKIEGMYKEISEQIKRGKNGYDAIKEFQPMYG